MEGYPYRDALDLQIADKYWNMLKDLSDNIKLRLATRLTASVLHEKAEAQEKSLPRTVLDKYCGAWEGEESADEIMATIKQNSTIRKPLSYE